MAPIFVLAITACRLVAIPIDTLKDRDVQIMDLP